MRFVGYPAGGSTGFGESGSTSRVRDQRFTIAIPGPECDGVADGIFSVFGFFREGMSGAAPAEMRVDLGSCNLEMWTVQPPDRPAWHARRRRGARASGLQCPIDARAADAEALGDGGWSDALRLQGTHLSGVNGRCAPFVNACSLGLGGAHDILQVADAARQPVDSGDHQRVASPQELQHGLEFGPASGAGAAALLASDDLASSGPQRGFLDGDILIDAARPCVSDNGHVWSFVSFGSRPWTMVSQIENVNSNETQMSSHPGVSRRYTVLRQTALGKRGLAGLRGE